mmetsp:Transcript_37774/g.57833  ORF Transcript_37774/g.57833 Transcript_37774/m.57833 type:complete len:238 (-) Transcript_37774:302-1015(-)
MSFLESRLQLEELGFLSAELFVVKIREVVDLKLILGLEVEQELFVAGEPLLIVVVEEFCIPFNQGVVRLHQHVFGQKLIFYLGQRVCVLKDIAFLVVQLFHLLIPVVEAVQVVVHLPELGEVTQSDFQPRSLDLGLITDDLFLVVYHKRHSREFAVEHEGNYVPPSLAVMQHSWREGGLLSVDRHAEDLSEVDGLIEKVSAWRNEGLVHDIKLILLFHLGLLHKLNFIQVLGPELVG